MTTVADFFKDLTLPTMPEVAHELIRSLDGEELPLPRLREVVTRDPVLALQLLRLANSAHFGAHQPVGTVEDAIARVGTGQVRSLALAAFFSDAFPMAPGLDRETFWRESQDHGALSQWLANGIGSDCERAWLTGFMVRLGELVMGLKAPACVASIENPPADPSTRWERERALLGWTEGEVSAELARAWNFPDDMARALDAAADPLAAQPFSRLGAVLHLAVQLASAPELGPQALQTLPPTVLDALSLDTDWLQQRLPQTGRYREASRLH